MAKPSAPSSKPTSSAGSSKKSAGGSKPVAPPRKGPKLRTSDPAAVNALLLGRVTSMTAESMERDSKAHLAFSIITLIVVVIATLGVRSMQPREAVLSVTNDFRVVKEPPLSSPMHEDHVVADWVAGCLYDMTSTDFIRARRDTDRALTRCFSDIGRRSWMSALEANRNLQTIQKKRIVTELVHRSAGIVAKKGINPSTNRFEWVIDFPVDVNIYSNYSETPTSTIRAAYKVTVSRAPTIDTEIGVIINSAIYTVGAK